jgi:hypothetical protein
VTGLEGETAIVGSLLLAGAVLAVAREAVRRNWVKVSFSFGVTTPDARLLKPRAEVRQPPAADPATAAKSPLREASLCALA